MNYVDVSAVNLAYTKPASQSSTYQTAVASRANDGSLSAPSCTTSGQNSWWAVDLEAPNDVHSVTVTNDRNDYFCNYR